MKTRIAERAIDRPLALVVGLLGVAGGNVVFHLLAGRVLGPEEYGSLSALLTILLALAVPAGAIQVALTAEAARIHQTGRRVRHTRTALQFGAAGLFVGAAVVLMGPLVGAYLRLESITASVLVGLFFAPALISLVLRAVLLGREQYLVLATVLMGGVVLRVGLGVVLLAWSPTSSMALFATVVSEILTTVALALACRSRSEDARLGWDLRVRVGELAGGFAAFTGFWLVVGMDTLLARHQLTASDAGMYAAAALAARSVLYVPQSIVTAAIPKFAGDDREAEQALFDTLLASLVVGLASVVAVLVAAEPLLEMVLGQEFDLSAPTLAYLAVASLWAALLNTLVNYHLARRSVGRANVSWCGAGLILVVGHFVGATTTLALVVLFGVVAAGLLSSIPLLYRAAPPAGTGLRGGAEIDLSVVLPVYNEGELAAAAVERLSTVLHTLDESSEIIVVDDGSDEATAAVLAQLPAPIRVVTHAENRGKGAAVRTGWSRARGQVLAYIDGDGDLDPLLVRDMYDDLELFGAHGIVGSKAVAGSQTMTSPSRRVLSAVGQRIFRTLFAVPVRDTQTGIKLFRRDVVADVLPRTHETGYLFDLEFLAVGAALGWDHVVEAPVRLARHRNSSIGIGAIVGTARDLAAFTVRLHTRARPRIRSELATAGVPS